MLLILSSKGDGVTLIVFFNSMSSNYMPVALKEQNLACFELKIYVNLLILNMET